MELQELKIKKVSKAVNGMKIIDNVTAAFLPGKITALIGPNGAGKTTLFHLITGELRVDTGRIIYKGDDVTFLAPYKIAKIGIGRLFQDVRIFDNLTVYENVACACNAHSVESPWFPFFNWKAMKNHNNEVKEKAEYYLNFVSLFTMKESQGSALSYGQQKLLAIARLLARGFSILLLDEPTAGLNTVMIKKVLGILEKIINEDNSKTIVIVEHNMGVVTDVADWVYFMNEGRIAFFGRTDHVLGHKEVREIYLGL